MSENETLAQDLPSSIRIFRHGIFRTNGYLVCDGRDAALVDPPEETAQVAEALASQGASIRALLCTHLHFDHAPGFAVWQQLTGLPVLAGAGDIACAASMLDRAALRGAPPVRAFGTQALTPGAHAWGTLACEVIHVPGHSPGSLCFHFVHQGILLSGDTLFRRCIGRTDLPESLPGTLEAAIRQRLFPLPPATRVFPGHGAPTTIGEELSAGRISPTP